MAYSGQPGGFGFNGKSYYTNINKPCEVHLRFTVNSADTAGLGITSLKSNGYVNNIFMHTSQTPGINNGFTNPNPLSGYVAIQMKNNFNYFIGSPPAFISANSGSDVKIDNSAMTAGQVYTITTLGNATLAKWIAIGVPVGVTPAVGVSFVALSNGGSGNTITSRVQTPSNSGVTKLEFVGLPNTMTNSVVTVNGGQWLFAQFLAPSSTFTGSALANHTHSLTLKNAAVADGATTRVNAGTNLLGANTGSDITIAGAGANGGIANASAGTPAGTIATSLIATAPIDGSIVHMSLLFDGSSTTIDGL